VKRVRERAQRRMSEGRRTISSERRTKDLAGGVSGAREWLTLALLG